MNRIVSIAVILYLLVICSLAQANNLRELTGDVKKDVNILIPGGKIIADIMETKINKRQEELAKKFKLEYGKITSGL